MLLMRIRFEHRKKYQDQRLFLEKLAIRFMRNFDQNIKLMKLRSVVLVCCYRSLQKIFYHPLMKHFRAKTTRYIPKWFCNISAGFYIQNFYLMDKGWLKVILSHLITYKVCKVWKHFSNHTPKIQPEINTWYLVKT